MKRPVHSCEVAVLGYALTPPVRHAGRPIGEITLDTCLRAITDAGLSPEQIDGLTTGSILPSAGGRAVVDGIDIVTSNWIMERLRVHARWVSGFQGPGQIPGSVALAANAVASGAADYVLVHRALSNPVGKYHENPMTEAAGASQWIAPQGLWGPPTQIAMEAMEYMQRYGATREDLARIVVEIRRCAAEVPWAYWSGKPLSFDDYMNARMIADPICLFDCDIPVDGAVAFVFGRADRAKDGPNRPVYVAGYSFGNLVHPGTMCDVEASQEMGAKVGRRLWENTGLKREDIDLPQIYDGFSPIAWIWLESLGYAPRGEAHRFVKDQKDMTKFFSGGGSLGNGRMHGIPPMLECYLQLSGRAGERQMPGVRAGLACHSHPHYGGVVAYANEKL